MFPSMVVRLIQFYIRSGLLAEKILILNEAFLPECAVQDNHIMNRFQIESTTSLDFADYLYKSSSFSIVTDY
jgi:hypothetical protein